MNTGLRKIIKWGGISTFGFLMFVAGQANQVMAVSKSVTAHFVSEWVALDKNNELTLQRYELLCRKPIGDSESFKKSIESMPLTHKECAEKANANELFAVIQKASDIVDLNWPLSEL